MFPVDRVRKVSQVIRARRERLALLVYQDRRVHVDSPEHLERKVYEVILENRVLEFLV